MGHIKEPVGIDFEIESRPLTKGEELALSEYIRAYKAKNQSRQIATKRKVRTTVRKKVIG